jgi:uncharacterized membrane protein
VTGQAERLGARRILTRVSKVRSVVVLVVIVAGLLTYATLAHGIGAVLIGVWLVVVLVVGFVTLAMNTGQYEWATGVIGKSIDSAVARVRAFVRRAWPPA